MSTTNQHRNNPTRTILLTALVTAIAITAASFAFKDILCKRFCKTNPSTQVTEGKYVQGEVVVEPSNDHPMGMFRVYIDESLHADKPLRGVMFNLDNSLTPIMYQPVYFTIEEEHGFQLAKNLTTTNPGDEKMYTNLNHLKDKLDINLHIDHQHIGAHNKVHIVQFPSSTYNGIANTYNVELCTHDSTTNDCVAGGSTFYKLIRTPNPLPPGFSGYLNVVDYVNGQSVHRIVQQHTHLYD